MAPVVETLAVDGRAPIRSWAYREARGIWARRGLNFEPVNEPLSRQEAGHLLAEVSVLLTGTSMNASMLETRFIDAARDLGIPSIALLDSWVNYTGRFSRDGSGGLSLPDRIAVMDARAKAEMTAEGFDPATIVITGQPAFDGLPTWRSAFTPERRRLTRAAFGVDEDGLLVVFVSQPFSALYESHPLATNLGFDERDVVPLVIAALEAAAATSRRPITLVIRPHPREDAAPEHPRPGRGIRIVVSADGDARAAACAADLVTGMNSIVLLEACYLQCLTVSIQPGLRGVDILPTNRLGLSRGVYDAGGAGAAIQEWLLDERARDEQRQRLRAFAPVPDATGRVVSLVHDMIQSRNEL